MSKAIAWIVEPKNGGNPYLTLKEDVADKRQKAGDFVTPYVSKANPPEPDEDDL